MNQEGHNFTEDNVIILDIVLDGLSVASTMELGRPITSPSMKQISTKTKDTITCPPSVRLSSRHVTVIHFKIMNHMFYHPTCSLIFLMKFLE